MRYLTLFLLLASSAFATLIPANRLTTWIVGDDVGVQGGFAQYLPGGINQRTDVVNAVSGLSIDNTGATDVASAINSGIAGLTTNQVLYFPAGVYRIDSGIGGGLTKDSYTLRGAGQFELSRSTNTLGTGTKTFTVPAGGAWTSGCGIWIWKWDRDLAPITSITRSSTTATVTTAAPHQRVTGETVLILGATESAYNGTYPITVTGASTFTYQVSGSPTTPATTSNVLRYQDSDYPQITSITRSGSLATVTISRAHGYSNTSQWTAFITGADQAEYNGQFTVEATSSTTFTYTVSGSPATPATTSTALYWSYAQLRGPNAYMQGTVTSYSGTTLVVDVDTAVGPASTWSMWKVGVTTFDWRGTAGEGIKVGSDASSYYNQEYLMYINAPTITGSVSSGDTSFSIDIGAENEPGDGDIMQVAVRNTYEADAGAVGDSAIITSTSGYEYLLRQMVRITSVSNIGGTNRTINFEPAMTFDMPSTRVPKAKWGSTSNDSEGFSEFVGVENLAVFGPNSTAAGGAITFAQTRNCWAYNVSAHVTTNYQMRAITSLWLTVYGSWVSHIIGQPGTSQAGLLISYCSNGQIENNFFGQITFPTVEVNNATVNTAFIFNYAPGTMWNTNHAPHNYKNLYEGNLAPYTVDDGYFGGSGSTTYLRNWFFGLRDAGGSVQGSVNLRRWAYNHNPVGNVMGTPNYADGAFGYGIPNIGGSPGIGTAEATLGTYWLHLTDTGGAEAELTTRTSDTVGTFTLAGSLVGANYENPYMFGGGTGPVFIRWGTGRDGQTSYFTGFASNTVTLTAGSGMLPLENTVVRFWPGPSGFQEQDDDVENTVIQKGNWLVSGSGGSQSSTGGDTIPDSYAYVAKPAYFGTLTWPPMNPASPNFSDGHAVIPIAYWYINGEQVPASESGSNATVSGTTTVTGSLTPP